MRRLLMIMVTIALTIVSCCYDHVEGDGIITTEERSVEDFNSIYAEGVFNVIIIQDDQFGVEVETDRNLQEIVTVKNWNHKLYLDIKENVNFDATQMNIYVYAPEFEIIDCDGVVNISSDHNIVADNLEIRNNGVGNIDMEIVCSNLEIYLNGVGNIYIEGESSYLKLRNNGIGRVDAYNLPVEYVDIINSGVGDSEIHVLEELDVTISGVGNVFYQGEPKIIRSTITGVGNLKSR